MKVYLDGNDMVAAFRVAGDGAWKGTLPAGRYTDLVTLQTVDAPTALSPRSAGLWHWRKSGGGRR